MLSLFGAIEGLGDKENKNAFFSLIMKSVHIVEVAYPLKYQFKK